MTRIAGIATMAALIAVPCLAQDRDGDKIPDAVEQALGSVPDFAEDFALLFHDGSAAEGDETLGKAFKDAPDLADVYLASVAQDRWLFKVTFTENYVGEPNTFILYLDVDLDESTGRQDANLGTDLMYVQKGGSFNLTEHTEGLRSDPLRMATVGDAIYICADLPLGEGNAEGKVRFKVLSHVSPPHDQDSDSMDWQIVELPEARVADKPRIGLPPPMTPIAQFSTDKPDQDGDGIPDEVELRLGMDPETRDFLHFLHDDKSIPEGDDTLGAYEKAPDVTKVYFGNVASDRWVWRVDFAEDYPAAEALLIFYLDVDHDLTTGRQDGARGVDIMLLCQGGSFSASVRNAKVTTTDRRVRGAVDGNSVYLSMDLLLNQNQDGNSEFRGFVLSQGYVNRSDSDSTDRFTVVGPGVSDRPKSRVVAASEFRSENAYIEAPWLGWREDLREMRAITLNPASAKLTRMKLTDRALFPERGRARAVFQSPAAGRYHLALVLRDSAVGENEVEVKVRGERVANCVAAQSDGALYLFVSKQPVKLAKGDPIEIIAAEPAQDFYVAEVMLTPKPPRPRGLEITHLTTYCPPQKGDAVSVDVCWLTNLPCQGRVKWGEGRGLDRTAEGEHVTYNHRVRLEGLARGASYSVQAISGGGEDASTSKTLSFVADLTRLHRGSARREQVKLSLLDAMEGDRPAWPVNGGVPIPEGALSSTGRCRLLNAGGNPVPAQFTELACWPDGSIKWLLVSLLHLGGPGEYTLEYGEDVAAAPMTDGVRVEEAAGGLRVTNGPLQVSLSRERFAPPGEVFLDVDGDGEFEPNEAVVRGDAPGFVLVDAEGKRYTSTGAPLSKLEVEEAGPVRTVVLAEGRFAGDDGELLSFRCRMYFYRGFPGVPTVFTLIADEGTSVFPPTMTLISSLTLPVTFARDMQYPGERLLQVDDARFVVTRDRSTAERDGRAPAAAAFGTGDRSLTVCLRDFWQLYPKAFSVEGSTITAEIFPELPEDQYAEHTDPKLLTQHYYWQRDGKYMIPYGIAPTYDLLFYFAPLAHGNLRSMTWQQAHQLRQTQAAGGAELEPSPMEQAWQRPVVLSSTPEHYCASGAFGDLAPEKPGVFEQFQDYMDRGLERVEAAREAGHEYSWMDYGDTYGERGVNWTNQEYDLQWGLLVQFARSGDLRYFDRAEQAARHTAGIDTINVGPNPSQVGIQKYHCLGHTGGHDIPRVEGAKYWFTSGGYNTGHMWTQGTYMTYCLTGDRRYLDSIELLSNWLAEQYTQSLAQWIHRNYGWSTIAVLGGYHTTANPFYLNAARLFCDNMIARQDPGTGVWAHPIGECTHAPHHMGGKVFMSGVDLTGIRMLDEIEPRDALKHAIVRTCDWMYHRMWHPWDNSFQYAQCTNYDRSSTHAGTYMACEGLAYACDLAKQPEFREMLLRSLADMIDDGPSGSGKGYAMQIRMVPYALTIMQRWGLKELPTPPPPKPVVSVDEQVYLLPGEPAALAVIVNNRGKEPIPSAAEIVALPEGLTCENPEAKWSAAPGVGRSPAFKLTGSAKTGDMLKIRYRVGETEGQAEVTVRAAERMELGEAVGYVGGEGDPLGAALKKLGISLPALPDLEPTTLAGYRALLVGCEAHEKNFVGLKDEPHRLLDFIVSGGRVVIVQLQDTSYRTHFLARPLAPSNESSEFGEIIVSDHPIFGKPHRIESLVGAISYDTIIEADAAWKVLATDAQGQPAVTETTLGDGTLLVIQPSVERYVTGEVEPRGTLKVETCGQFIENVVEYLRTVLPSTQ